MNRNRGISTVLAIAVIITIIAATVGAYYIVVVPCGGNPCTSASSTTPTTSFSSSSSSTSRALSNTGVSQTTYTASNSNLGIDLSFSLNATATQPGGRVDFQAFVYNELGRENNVSASSIWSIPRLIMDPCGPVDSPVAVVTIPGHYDEENLSSAPTPEYGAGCTTVEGGIRSYSFQPYSDYAYVIGGSERCIPSPCLMGIGYSGTFVGYVNNGQASPFVRGVYTVVAEDEWGDVALASFTVS